MHRVSESARTTDPLKLYLLHVEPEGDKNGHAWQLLSHKACFFHHSPVAVLMDALIPPQLLQEPLVHVIIRERLSLPQHLPPGHSWTWSTVWPHHPWPQTCKQIPSQLWTRALLIHCYHPRLRVKLKSKHYFTKQGLLQASWPAPLDFQHLWLCRDAVFNHSILVVLCCVRCQGTESFLNRVLNISYRCKQCSLCC